MRGIAAFRSVEGDEESTRHERLHTILLVHGTFIHFPRDYRTATQVIRDLILLHMLIYLAIHS